MAFCSNCGSGTSGGERFCSTCGQPLSGGEPKNIKGGGNPTIWILATIALIVVIVMVIVLLPGVADKDGRDTTGSTRSEGEPIGSSSGNISSLGFAAYEDGWVYILNPVESGNYIFNTYRMRPDGSEIEKVSDKGGLYMNVVDGWIYFSMWRSEMGGIYRMNTDGSDLERLSQDWGQYINVHDGWIYYTNGDFIYELEGGSIYRMRIDGSGREKLWDGYAVGLNLVDGWIYCVAYDQQWQHGIFRMRTDGSERQKLSDGGGSINVVDGSIYYLYFDHDLQYDDESEVCLYRMRTDGTNKEKLGEIKSELGLFNVFEDWVYFKHDGTYRFNIESSSIEKISERYVIVINVVEGRVYFVTHETVGCFRLDGSDFQLINFESSEYKSDIFTTIQRSRS